MPLTAAEINYLTALRDYQATRAVIAKYSLPSIKVALARLLVALSATGAPDLKDPAAVLTQGQIAAYIEQIFKQGLTTIEDVPWDDHFTSQVTKALANLSLITSEVAKYSD